MNMAVEKSKTFDLGSIYTQNRAMNGLPNNTTKVILAVGNISLNSMLKELFTLNDIEVEECQLGSLLKNINGASVVIVDNAMGEKLPNLLVTREMGSTLL